MKTPKSSNMVWLWSRNGGMLGIEYDHIDGIGWNASASLFHPELDYVKSYVILKDGTRYELDPAKHSESRKEYRVAFRLKFNPI